jgi:hypothetical protein
MRNLPPLPVGDFPLIPLGGDLGAVIRAIHRVACEFLRVVADAIHRISCTPRVSVFRPICRVIARFAKPFGFVRFDLAAAMADRIKRHNGSHSVVVFGPRAATSIRRPLLINYTAKARKHVACCRCNPKDARPYQFCAACSAVEHLGR